MERDLDRNALVCIAKNEDRHIREWIDYHSKIGFSDIFIYQNNWRVNLDGFQTHSQVHLIEWDGEAMQLPAYNNFIDKHWQEFSWAAFFDCDELLSIDIKKWPGDQPLIKILRQVDQINPQPMSIGVNWRFFGGKNACDMGIADESLRDILQKDMVSSYLNCEENLDRHVKVLVNFKRARNSMHFVNPHCLNLSLAIPGATVSVADGRPICGPWNDNPTECGIQLNHYYQKNRVEFAEKIARGKADTPKSHPMAEYKESDFDLHGKCPAVDANAYLFYHGDMS